MNKILKFSEIQWALCNFGILRSTHRLRREAIRAAEKQTGKPWKECRKYMQVFKVRVVPLGDK